MKKSDFLVIGSGLAGLSFAIEMAENGTVTVLSKLEPEEGSTRYAQGGIAAVWDPDDTFEAHIEDTLKAGAGVCHREVVEMVCRDAPERIRQLVGWGAEFDRIDSSPADNGEGSLVDVGSESGKHRHTDFELGREGGHSARRILHFKDKTGAEIQRALYAQALKHPNIKIVPNQVGIDLITKEVNSGREVAGVYALDRSSGEISAYSARVTMLATGGVGKVYLYTSNPDVATGDGIAMAYRAGAQIGSMEFIQFHPTCLYHPNAKGFLITEAMRGEGAILKTIRGERFLEQYTPDLELAPRDIVARAIDDIMKRTGDDYVLLDISHRDANFIRSRFPMVYEQTKQYGFDMTTGPIPVVPAAHYCCGGVVSDLWGQTNLGRLYVAGETAHTGLHGANRLASNSLLEAIVFGHRAARHTIASLSSLPPADTVPEWDYLDTVESREEVLVSYFWDEVRRTTWNLVGIVRSDRRLELARRRIEQLKAEVRDYYWSYRVTADLIELRNLIQIAELIIESAAARRESRGLHFNINCPERDDENWRKDIVLKHHPFSSKPTIVS